jgi:hypothetical protein
MDISVTILDKEVRALFSRLPNRTMAHKPAMPALSPVALHRGLANNKELSAMTVRLFLLGRTLRLFRCLRFDHIGDTYGSEVKYRQFQVAPF